MVHQLTERLKAWGKENMIVFLYFVFAVLLELTAVFVVEGSPFMTRPFLSLGLLAFVCGIILLIPNRYARTVLCCCMLFLQAGLDLVFSVIYQMTDQYFDLGMFNLRNDAFAILEGIPVDFITFYTGLALCIGLLVFGLRYAYAKKSTPRSKKSLFFYVGLALAGLATLGISFLSYYPREAEDKYDEMLDGKTQSAYSAYGMIGNLLGEVGKATFQKVTPIAPQDIDEFIYGGGVAEPTDYFGVCKDKNVVVILAESLEWFTFLQGENTEGNLEEEYLRILQLNSSSVSGENSSVEEPRPEKTEAELRAELKADLKAIYPNLTEYYEESVVMTNFHGREKTDIAETLSILGSYPTGAYVNYEYANNTIPYTLPNLLKEAEGENVQIRSFHNGFKSFYNRQQAHATFGFEGVDGKASPIDMYDMEKYSDELEKTGSAEVFHNYMESGDRNLDSEMVATAKDWMFPTDKRFYTYITTITMHGMYYDRANLRKENNTKLEERLALLEKYKPTDQTAADFADRENLYYYMTTGLELDYMLGLMKEDLQAKGLWDKTVVVLFGDHNAYYQETSNYVKGISNDMNEATDKKFTDLYNVPFMIRDTSLKAAIEKNRDTEIIKKFTCTADIVPTLLDLLGIRYFKNLYYGHSVFSTKQSVLYSRAYGVFIGDGVVRRSVKSKLYEYDGLTEIGIPVADTLSSFEEEGASLVKKIKFCDYIFRQNHFGNKENYQRFQEEMKKING